jgi:hypothetical protein
MVKKLSIMLLAACLLSPAAALAQAKPYLGASLGAAFHNTSVEDITGEDFKLEGEEFSWKIFGGIRGAQFFAIEGSYVHFGKIENTVNDTSLDSKKTGWDLFVVGNLSAGPIDVFGKAGILWWRDEGRIEDAPFDTKGNDFAWGLGGALRLGGLGVRVEYERFELEGDDNLALVTAGVFLGM